jgi:hypothetical protein
VKTKVKVRKERDYRPHADFHHAVWIHLQHAKARHEGWHYSVLSAILLSAFTVEAYLNYVGPALEAGWDDFDKASPLAKLRHVACLLKIEMDFSKRPFQTVNDLFSFRNRMAHPRSESLVVEYISDADGYSKDFYIDIKPKWLVFATEANATRCYEDVEAVVVTINSRLPKPARDPLSNPLTSGQATTYNEGT